ILVTRVSVERSRLRGIFTSLSVCIPSFFGSVGT
ncbi:MAG: hypothetical protein QOJ52_3793, partial [Acidimicrobiaceae bacterium]|nr:hypothetical protein [Acidimicrobiaceae bacterium]